MTEAAATSQSPAPAPVWVGGYRVNDIRVTKECKFIRLINDQERTNAEYSDKDVDISEFRVRDFVECWIVGGHLKGIRFPAKMDPVHQGKSVTPATPVKPVEQPKPAPVQTATTQSPVKVEEVKSPQTQTPVVQKPKSCKLLKREGETKVLILTLKGEEKWFTLEDKAKDQIKRLQDGQNVKLGGFKGETAIGAIYPATEIGEYDPNGWVKSSGGGGGYRKPYDPEAEKRKQNSIERQNARGISKDIITLCFQQYPISGHPDNFEKAVTLFPQLIRMVKDGETILMGERK